MTVKGLPNKIAPPPFLMTNFVAVCIIGQKEKQSIQNSLAAHTSHFQKETAHVMENYVHSFQLFSYMLTQKLQTSADPDAIWVAMMLRRAHGIRMPSKETVPSSLRRLI